MPSPSLNRQIALIYRIYFLYLDPIFALSGVYLILADPAKFLISTTPQPITVSNGAITPLVSLLLTNIAALYAYLAVSSAVVLRVTEERAVWVAVVGGLVMSDVGHIWGVYEAAPERMFEFIRWTHEEIINMGILSLGLALRLGFLFGIGNTR